MRRRKALATLIVLVAIIASMSVAFIYVHDNPVRVTPISSINAGITPVGTNVTLKGEFKEELASPLMGICQHILMSDGSGNISFYCYETRLQIGWTLIVRGTVQTNKTLYLVSSVEQVLLFP